MTIASEIQRIKTNIANAYTVCDSKGATMPATQNSANLADCIDSISGGSATLITKNITQNGTYNASSDNADGYSSVTVNVPSSGGVGIPREVDSHGIYSKPQSQFTFSLPSNATDIGPDVLEGALANCGTLKSVDLSSLTTLSYTNAMKNAFQGCYNITSIDLTNLTLVGSTTVMISSSMENAFQSCKGLTSVDLSSLTTVAGSRAMYQAFQGCTNVTYLNLSNLTTIKGGNAMYLTFNGFAITTLDLSSLTTVNDNQAMNGTFQGCKSLTSVDLSSLTTVNGSKGMYQAFWGCQSLTSVDLSSLTTINIPYVMQNTFKSCTSLTSLSFPALTSTSFGSYKNQFNGMLSGVTGCTVHFPSNLQSVIGSWSDVTAGFGGTNTTVLFDLPATT